MLTRWLPRPAEHPNDSLGRWPIEVIVPILPRAWRPVLLDNSTDDYISVTHNYKVYRNLPNPLDGVDHPHLPRETAAYLPRSPVYTNSKPAYHQTRFSAIQRSGRPFNASAISQKQHHSSLRCSRSLSLDSVLNRSGPNSNTIALPFLYRHKNP